MHASDHPTRASSNTAQTSDRAWHTLTGEDALVIWQSDREQGLSQANAQERLQRIGPNTLPEPKRKTLLSLWLHQLASPLIYLLLLAAAIAYSLGERTDAVVIFFVVILNAVIGAVQEGRAERSLAALRKLSSHKARVLRDGTEQVVEAGQIVPGDVLLLAAGDVVAADARIVDDAALRLAEAALTGESLPASKGAAPVAAETLLADRSSMVYAGTHVTAGRARAVVIATGTATELGRIAQLASSAAEAKTPLERRVDQFGRYVIYAALVLFALVLGVGLMRGMPFAEIFMLAVSQLVGMVPEGLPVAMTIALAVGVQRMAARGAVVRRLSAVETLGSTTVICTDKTGTLTRNEMSVIAIALADGEEIAVSGVGYAPHGDFRAGAQVLDPLRDPRLRELLQAGLLCNDASLAGPEGDDEHYVPFGDPTEVALVTAALKAGLVPEELQARHPRRAELPFDSDAKMMATQHSSPEGPFVIVKGAPEALLELCAFASQKAGEVAIDDAARAELRRRAQGLAERALRVLGVAIVRGAELDGHSGFAGLRGRACLLGLFGEMDPPRSEVADAVRRSYEAGIRTVMVTGDHKATGLAIAQQLGIAREGDQAVDGLELERMSDAELQQRMESIAVFARVHPAQKLRIIEALQRSKHSVAMTGDGVNDAPALARADVGVAMGITGTDVAKDAAKIVITDDDFATIVAAVEEGRVVYRNIKKAILLLFSTSFAEVAVLLVAMLLGYPPPFLAVQILWNNLVTEGVITVNLVMEPPEGDEMRRPPIATDEPLLTRMLLTRMWVMVPAIVIATLGWFMWRTHAGVPSGVVRTETFTLLAVCEWYNVLNCRSETRSALRLGVLGNPWLLMGLLAGNALQLAVVYWAPLGRIFGTTPIGLREFFVLGAVGSVVLWSEELRKLVARRSARGMTPKE